MKKKVNGLRSFGILVVIISFESIVVELKDIWFGWFNFIEWVICDIKDLIKVVFIDESY